MKMTTNEEIESLVEQAIEVVSQDGAPDIAPMIRLFGILVADIHQIAGFQRLQFTHTRQEKQ